jgi:hypothetical protein
VDHILGEVFVDSLATPAGPAPKLSLVGAGGGSLFGGTAAGGGSTGFSSGGGSSYSSSGGSLSSQPASSSATAQNTSSLLGPLANKPTWLLAAYLLWQALVLGTAFSLRQWRLGGAA